MISVEPASRGYLGRFAPSPTGPLHFGSLVAAVGSFLDARHVGGRWTVRIDDLDRPRTVAGAAEDILRTLEAFALHWDGPVVYQSDRDPAYAAALETLRREGHAFACACSRREVREAGLPGPAGPVYPGTCRRGLPAGRRGRCWRLLTADARVSFRDAARGEQRSHVETEIGDFVIRRADRLFAYHLACVVDDGELGATHVVRGGDLLECTAPQVLLQQRLGLPSPQYLHLPVALGPAGTKLSKQTMAPAADRHQAPALLHRVLAFLGQAPPPELAGAAPAEQLTWAIRHWDRARLPRAAALAEIHVPDAQPRPP